MPNTLQSCMLILDDEAPKHCIAIKSYRGTSSSPGNLDMPTEYHPALSQVLQDHAMLIKTGVAAPV